MSDIDAEILSDFVEDTRRDLKKLFILLTQCKTASNDIDARTEILRLLHTIKGNSRFVKNDEIEQAAHDCETLLGGDINEGTFDVIESRLEHIQNEIDSYSRCQNPPSQAQLPIPRAWERLPDILASLQQGLNKSIALNFEGEGLEAPRAIVEGLRNPLMHLVTNAATHGIEEKGSLYIEAKQSEDALEIIVQDNGRGLNTQAIRERANEKNIPTDGLDEAALHNLIFTEGFSTKDQADMTSGRGIGLYAVAKDIQSLNGEISVYSAPNQGTRFTIRIFVSDF